MFKVWFRGLTDTQRGTLYSLLGALWAAAFLIPYKMASERAQPRSVALAMLTAAAVLNSVLRLVQAPRPALPSDVSGRGVWTAALALSVFAVVGNICSATALAHVDPATVSVVLRSEVLFVGVLGAGFLRERVPSGFWLGAALALTGLAILKAPSGRSLSPGLGYALGAALCFSLMQLVIRRLARRVSLVRVNGLRLWLSALLLTLVPGAASGLAATDWTFFACALLAAAFGPVTSRLCLMLALRDVTAAHATLVMLLAPVFALGMGYVAFGDVPGTLQLLGGLLMLLGIAVPLLRPTLRARG